MTIKNITVQADYCFGEQPLLLPELKKVNFVFAPNGAGKSTISKALAQQPTDPDERAIWPTAPTSSPIRVFNEAYRSRVLNEQVNGIFTIGEESESVNKKISALEDGKRTRRANRQEWLKAIGSADDKKAPTGALGEIETARFEASVSVFDAHKNLDSSVVPIVFEGYRNDRAKFFREAGIRFGKLGSLATDVNWESISARARSLSGDKVTRLRLPVISTASLLSPDDIAEVGTMGAHGGDGRFAALILHLKNEEWVSKGREYIDDADGKCPFCQNQAPDDLESELSNYFAGGFDKALGRSLLIESAAKSKARKLEDEISALENAVTADSEIDDSTFGIPASALRRAAELLGARLHERSNRPTQAVVVSDIDEFAAEVNALIGLENQRIDGHNRLVANAVDERRRLIDDGWSLFVSDGAVAAELSRYRGIESSKTQRVNTLREQLEGAAAADEVANQEIAELRQKISNTAEVADRINKLLSAMGFHRFSLKVADAINGGYRIVRENGTLAFESLSEGEKSFICFAYFWESLFGTAEANATPEDVVAVIDDPISSLDSDALFMVAAYIRDAAKRATDEKSNLQQLIVLTHNTQFHHEAAYAVERSSKERRYFRLVKKLGGFTEMHDDGNRSRIRGSYALLWHCVVEAAQNEDESDLVRVGVFNIVRRILEGYFKTIGNISDFDRPDGISPTEARMVAQFHMWANSGSHTITDDIDQTIDVGRTRDFLVLFMRYFEWQGHGAHFEMMIAASDGADLLGPNEIFARS
ncbi:AAA family ATPase [Salinibacterium sp. SWN248]|uniref:AAA family ATPase n=1 Tax=Salinibacterium sp. SWN248 TaxID=2792056 RepID=UPI0018CCCFF1|nr:AAA family ATPase [Salinibacterium sp. SWN248]MBH0024639.1 AAA family ATPase [Salinibacterium sp. SWN248]